MDELVRDFIAETREGIEALDSELVRFEQDSDNPEILGGIFRLIHTIKGTCGFIGLSRLQAVAHAAETVLGGFRDGSVVVTGEAVTAVLEAVDLIRMIVEGLAADGVEPAGDDAALIVRLEAATNVMVDKAAIPTAPAADGRSLLERLGGEATLDAACEMTAQRIGAVAGCAALASADDLLLQGGLRTGLVAAARGFGDAANFSGQLQAFTGEPPARELTMAVLGAVSDDLIALDIAPADVAELVAVVTPPMAASAPAPIAAPTPVEAPAPAKDGEALTSQTIRVDVDALEHLMTVASELVLIRNQLLQILRLEPESPFAAPLHRLNQVTSELQEGVMTTRMQPISGAWAKLPRLVRDLSRDLGKEIDLVTHGQDTELDRQVLELIKDPLTHMIRNAADHGLETPAERLAAGKGERGKITLSARHEGGAIVIEMTDDGRGLSASRIRSKAVSSGVVGAAQAEAMSDAEARRLIFLPGFSTAAEVTAVSGRGVGMDVVRTNIEKIGGVIELSSDEGAGTRFTIRIPLTLTIVSALIVECCGERFALPQSSVIELVSASGGGHTIEHLNGSAVLRLRDRLLPLVSLRTLLDLPAENERREETCIIVAKVGASTFGVIVDRVFDTEEIVVKPVSSVLRHLKVYSGATILGDGSVIMILDFKGISPDVDIAAGGMEDETAASAQADQSTAILVFRASGEALKAAPLAGVSRIEEVDRSAIETVDGRSVIQYRGRLMPVVDPLGQPAAAGETGLRPLLVFSRGERSIGLMVEEIVDILDCVLAMDLKPAGEAALGSMIIAGRATEMIDIEYFWRRALDEDAAPVPVQHEPAQSRLLVIDDSALGRSLLAPLLGRAGYAVTVAAGAEEALALHDNGAVFDLIMADTSGEAADRLGAALSQASRWHAVPMMSLGLGGGDLLDAVSDTLSEPLRRAA